MLISILLFKYNIYIPLLYLRLHVLYLICTLVLINATLYHEHSFTYWKRVYARIFTATLHLLNMLKGIHAQLFWLFFAKLIIKSPKSWLSTFSVSCLKYCRSVQELWDSVNCINHKYTDLAYPSPVNKVVRISPCAYMYIQYSATPTPFLENRENLYMYATNNYMTLYYTHGTILNRNIPIYFSFRSLSMSQSAWHRYLKIAHATCTRFGSPKAPASLLVHF